jgi:hypothetical protein
MDSSRVAQMSITPTIARQTPKNEFGQVLSNTLGTVSRVGGALLGALPGMPIVSGAVSAVSSIANAATGAVNIHTGTTSGGPAMLAPGGAGLSVGSTVSNQGSIGRSAASIGNEPAGMNEMISQMRADADRSMMMQMNMQTESREYNTLTNILKLRHDSAKAAINNIR